MNTQSLSSPPSVPFFRKKLAALAIIAGAVALPSWAQTVVTDTWSTAGGSWTAANSFLTGKGITAGNWANSNTWTGAGLTPHSFTFTANNGSTGGSTLSVAGQTAFSFASANYYNTINGASPTFALTDAVALPDVTTISLSLHYRAWVGANEIMAAGGAPTLYHDGEVVGIEGTKGTRTNSTINYTTPTNYYYLITYTWDVSSIDVSSFYIDWTASSTNANYINTISLAQTAAVPEPAAFAGLVGAAVLTCAGLRRRRRA